MVKLVSLFSQSFSSAGGGLGKPVIRGVTVLGAFLSVSHALTVMGDPF